MSDKLEIKIDDVVSVVQTLGTIIQKKVLSPEEFRQVQPAWERLTDTIAKLQRRTALEKLYPAEAPVQIPAQVPVPVIETSKLPNEPDSKSTAGIEEVEDGAADLSI